MRVCMLTSQFMPEVFGGAEQQCLRLSQALTKQGVSPHILTSRSNPATPEHEIMGGVPVTRILVPAPPQIGGRRIRSTVLWNRAVAEWFAQRRDQVDIIHCHQAKLNAWIGARIAKSLGVPMIVKLGSAGPNLDFYSLERKRFIYGKLAARTVARDADAIVAISDEMMHDLKAYEINADRLHKIPNGVIMPDLARKKELRQAVRSTLGIPDDAPVILFVGRLETQKNVTTLINSHAKLTQAPYLVLVGDGALRAELAGQAAAVGASNRVRFVGRVDDVLPYLAAADLFALPALAEGMSNALLEAMAAGVPPIASSVSGNTDLIAPGRTGWLYGSPTDVGALTAALDAAMAMSTEDRSRIGNAAQDDVRKHYSIDAIAQRYAALYHGLPSKRRAA